jgi:hypothetical protein
MHVAAMHGCTEVLSVLLALGGEVSGIDTVYNKATPLHLAARMGQFKCAKALITAGASLSAQDAAGETALHHAARGGFGALFCSMMRTAEQVKPGSGEAALKMKSDRGKLPIDVAGDGITRGRVETEMKRLGQRVEKRKNLLARMRRGVTRARNIGGNLGSAAADVRAQRQRYGRVRSRRSMTKQGGGEGKS